MKIISVLNAKGGVAKTTTALALADYLSKDHKVLFMDLDPQANATSTLLNLDVGKDAEDPTLYDVIDKWVRRDNRIIEKAIRSTSTKNLDICPAHLELEPSKDIFKQKLYRPLELISDILEPVKENYDFVVLDCPADISLYVESAIFTADLCLVPTTYDMYGFKAVQIVIRFMMSIHRNPDYRKFRILYTRVKSRATKVQEEMQRYIEVFEKRDVVLPFRIPEEQAVTNAQSKHDSLMLDKPYKNSTARSAYKKLGEFVKDYCYE